MSVILPLLFVVSLLFPEYKWFVVLLHITMLAVGLLFILDFKFRKPTNRELVIIVAVVAVAVLLVLFYNEGWWKFNYLYKKFPWKEAVIYDPDGRPKGKH